MWKRAMWKAIAALLFAAGPYAALAAAATVAISPGYTSIGVNQTLQYTATVTGLADTSVTWQVVGKVGGNATYGTISSGGLYTAPATIPANGITITAVASDKTTSTTTYVNVAPAGPTITSVTPNPVKVGNYTITLTGSQTSTPTWTPTATPSTSPTWSPTITLTGTQTWTPTWTPTATPSTSPTWTPTITLTGTQTRTR